MSQCVEREEKATDRSESPTSSCKGKPPDFNDPHTQEEQDRMESPAPSVVSMKSDRSMGLPPNLKDVPHLQSTWKKIPEDWKCILCFYMNTAKDLRCRNCYRMKNLCTYQGSITALPTAAADRKSWHWVHVRCRDINVHSLVEDMSTGDPAEDIKDLVTVAQNIERNIYESANSGDEYYRLLEEKSSDLKNKQPMSISMGTGSIRALPLSAAHMRKPWHEGIRQITVGWMSTGDPAGDIKDLVTDALNIEMNMYGSTNSPEEYYELMYEKKSELEKKRQTSMEKRVKKRSEKKKVSMDQSGQMEMKSMDQTSTLPLPPGDKSSSMMTGQHVQADTPASVSSSTDLRYQHVQTGSSMTSLREVKKEDDAEEEGAGGGSKMVKGQPDVKMEEKPVGTIPLLGEMEEHPVTESLSSPHPSLELQVETDLSSCLSGLRIEESISLPRSHSLTSLNKIPFLESNTGFRAKRSYSLNDVTLLDKTQRITPDIIFVENKERYRFHCNQAGLFQCNVTDLVFKMETEGDVTYRTVPWHQRILAQLGKRPAGPLFDIKGSQGAASQLGFPHCEILSMGAGKFLSVAHVMDDDGIELIKPLRITETHVIIDVTGFSLFGIIKDIKEMFFGPSPVQPSPVELVPVQALVSLFYTPPIDDDHPSSILKVLLLPRNVVLRDVIKERKETNGEEIYIGNPPCKLIPKQEYTLSTSPQDDSITIQPNEAEFETSFRDYIETFDVILKQRFSSVSVLLRSTKTADCPWKRDVDLSAAALRKHQVQRTLTLPAEERLFSVRSRFINSVSDPVLNGVLDKLFQKRVMTKEEYDNANVRQVTQDKARFVINAVRNKGTAASSSLILFLCETDPFLSKHLGLM